MPYTTVCIKRFSRNSAAIMMVPTSPSQQEHRTGEGLRQAQPAGRNALDTFDIEAGPKSSEIQSSGPDRQD
jgi:phage-related protein